MKTVSFLYAKAAKAGALAAGMGALLAVLLAAPAAHARDDVTWSVGVGVPGVVVGATNGSSYTVKPPIYYVPPPPPLPPVYRVSPGYVAPPPVVYAPPVYSYQYQYAERQSGSYNRHHHHHHHDRYYRDRD